MFIYHTLRQALCPVVVSQHKMNIMVFLWAFGFILVFFNLFFLGLVDWLVNFNFRVCVHSWEGPGRSWGKDKT